MNIFYQDYELLTIIAVNNNSRNNETGKIVLFMWGNSWTEPDHQLFMGNRVNVNSAWRFHCNAYEFTDCKITSFEYKQINCYMFFFFS